MPQARPALRGIAVEIDSSTTVDIRSPQPWPALRAIAVECLPDVTADLPGGAIIVETRRITDMQLGSTYREIITSRDKDGQPTAADSTPVLTVRRNGDVVAAAASGVSIRDLGGGLYEVVATLVNGWAITDALTISAAWAVAGIVQSTVAMAATLQRMETADEAGNRQVELMQEHSTTQAAIAAIDSGDATEANQQEILTSISTASGLTEEQSGRLERIEASTSKIVGRVNYVGPVGQCGKIQLIQGSDYRERSGSAVEIPVSDKSGALHAVLQDPLETVRVIFGAGHGAGAPDEIVGTVDVSTVTHTDGVTTVLVEFLGTELESATVSGDYDWHLKRFSLLDDATVFAVGKLAVIRKRADVG